MLKTYNVTFFNGESRQQPGKPCDYMLCLVEDEGGRPVELYTEVLEPSDLTAGDMAAWDYAMFDDMKVEIIRQAELLGVAADQLAF